MKLTKSIFITSLCLNLLVMPMHRVFACAEPNDEVSQNLIDELSAEQLQHYEEFCAAKGSKDWRLEEEDGEIAVYCFD